MQPSFSVKKEIFRLYNKNPKGWYVLIKKDQIGYYDTIIAHEKDVWFIKEEQVNPYELIGFGVKKDIEDDEALKSIRPYQFGFRPLSKKIADEVLESFNNDKSLDRVMSKIIREKPLPINRIKSEFIVQGPVIYPAKPMELVSNQGEIDMKLRAELKKLIYKKYPHLLTTYF
jgi:hypothetical protein